MLGLPDGMGAFDNGDGTFTILMTHEVMSKGIVREHGGRGVFASPCNIRLAIPER